MSPKPEASTGSGWSRTLPLLRTASVFVIVAGLRAASSLLVPLLVAAFLTILATPILDALRRWGVGRRLAIFVTFLMMVAVLGFVGLLMSGAVLGFLDRLPFYQELLTARSEAGFTWLQERSPRLAEMLSPARLDINSVFDLASNILGGTVRGVASAFSFLVLTLIALLFLLSEATVLPDKLRNAFGDRRGLVATVQQVAALTQRYLGVKTAVSLGTGILVAGWTWLFGLDFPLVWGMVAFFLNYIPVVGSILAAVPAVLLAAAQLGPTRALFIALGYVAINLVIGNLIEPTLMGRGFGLSSFAVLLSLVFWGWVWGPAGMILSVPLTMIFKIIIDQTGRLRWLSVFLDRRTQRPANGEA